MADMKVSTFLDRYLRVTCLLVGAFAMFGCFGGSCQGDDEDDPRLAGNFATLPLAPGESTQTTLSVQVVDPINFPVQGPQRIEVHSTEHVKVTPDILVLDVSSGSATANITVEASADSGSVADRFELVPITWHGLDIGKGHVQFKSNQTGGDFEITADPLVTSTTSHGITTPIHFTVTSKNGYSGHIQIGWSSDELIPNETAEFGVDVAPGQPVTFDRTLYRSVDHHNPCTIKYRGVDAVKSITHEVTLTVNYAP